MTTLSACRRGYWERCKHVPCMMVWFAVSVLMRLCGRAEHSTGWWNLPGSEAVLEYALAVQQRIRSSWEAAASQPPHQPWRALTALLCAGQAMPEAHRALLLRVVLELPPPTQVQRSSWKHDTTSHPSFNPAVRSSTGGLEV